MLAYTSIAVFLFSAIALVIPSGFSLGALMLLLGAAWLLRPATRRVPLQRQDWLLGGAFVCYFIVSVLNNLVHHAPVREYDTPLRFMLALPALWLLRAWPPRPQALWGGCAVGAIGALLLSLWQLCVLGLDRPGGSTNPIQYGNIAMVLGLLSACGLVWAAGQRRALAWRMVLGVGCVAGVAASMISGSRGSWLAVPPCLLLAAAYLVRSQGWRPLAKAALCGVIGLALLWLVPQTGLRQRTELAVTQADQYENHNATESSVGTRMELLRVAMIMAPQHLVLGFGKQGMLDYKAQLIDDGLAAEAIREHTHLHNEYLDAIVKHGVPGLLAVLVLYLVPLAAFLHHLHHQHHQHADRRGSASCALGGAMLMISYLAFGLTQAFLTHNNGVMVLAFMAVILWSAMRAADGGSPERQART